MPRVNHPATPEHTKNYQLGTERQSRWTADSCGLAGGAMWPPQPQQLLALQRAEIASPKCPFYAHGEHYLNEEDRSPTTAKPNNHNGSAIYIYGLNMNGKNKVQSG